MDKGHSTRHRGSELIESIDSLVVLPKPEAIFELRAEDFHNFQAKVTELLVNNTVYGFIRGAEGLYIQISMDTGHARVKYLKQSIPNKDGRKRTQILFTPFFPAGITKEVTK